MKAKSPKGTLLFYPLYFTFLILYSEMIVKAFSGTLAGFSVYLIPFGICFAIVSAMICSVLPKKAGLIAAYVISGIYLIIFGTQLVYHHIYGSFLSVAQLGMGADAITNFGGMAMIGILESAGGILLLLLPIAALVFFTVVGLPYKLRRLNYIGVVFGLLITVSLHFLNVALLPVGGRQNYSAFDIYENTFVLEKSEKYFGVLTTLRLEMQTIMFGSNEDVKIDPIVIPPDDDPPVPTVYADNITDIDFDLLSQNETDSRLKTLHEYFAAQTPTKQNEHTGQFKDYNVIEFCCESFSPYFIDRNLTPTLYNMMNSGFVFDNYYNTICDNTSNGEYALCVGLLPDTSLLKKGWNSFYSFNSFTAAKNNSLKFCLGNQLKSLGYKTYAIHNYHGYYYKRKDTHPNMGYTFLHRDSGLKKTKDFPSSDLEMMEQTLPMLLEKGENGERVPFHAYYLTFSGHMPYNFKANTGGGDFSYNAMALKNKEITENLPYSTAVKAYVAAQYELERALSYTVDTLRAAGELDKTLIIMTADHYPYNLGLEKLGELAGEQLDSQFGKYKSRLIFWTSSMTETVYSNVPCCTLDILPTVSNLLGLEYDSRLLMGTDILSTGNHVAILGDRSFITDKVMYDCNKGTHKSIGEEVSDEYLESWISYVKNKFTVSSEMLYTDYYRVLYGTK